MAHTSCACMIPPFQHSDFESTPIGVDQTHGRYGEVSLKRCKSCGQWWLHYLFELEAFTESGRWFRGMISEEEAKKITPEAAIPFLENMDWYFYGGSYFRTTGKKRSGDISSSLL